MNEDSKSSINESNKKSKSELFHIWKKSRVMYEMFSDSFSCEDWVRKNIAQAYELVDKALAYCEYQKIFPEKESAENQGENNFLSNDDRRYPVPAESESGDQFVTRCIYDPNMRKRYPVQADRFSACMSIFNENQPTKEDAEHYKKFDDPMQKQEEDLPDPQKPIMP